MTTPQEHAALLRELAKQLETDTLYVWDRTVGEKAGELAGLARQAAEEIEAEEKYHQGVLPMLMSKTGSPHEPVTEYIECTSISGGADYVDGMPRCLTLHRVMEEDGVVGEIYANYVQVAPGQSIYLSSDRTGSGRALGRFGGGEGI